MKSNEYWENRSNARMHAYHLTAEETSAKIRKAYNKAISDINNDLDRLLYRYTKDHKLTPKEALELLNDHVSQDEIESLKEQLKTIKDKKIKAKLRARINSPAYRARMTRMQAIKESIYLRCKAVADAEIALSTYGHIKNIKDAYLGTIYDIQQGVALGFNVADISDSKIKEILAEPWSGKHYSQRIWENTDTLSKKLQETILSGVESGKTVADMAAEIEDLGNGGKFAANRLVRTETTYIANQAEMESYKECDIEKYVFLATLDVKTSEQCRLLDSKKFKVSEGKPGTNLPPMHVFCRSTTLAFFDDESLANMKRRARDPETGKTYVLDKNMSFEEWREKHVVKKYGAEKAEIFEKRIKNESSDRKQYEKYKTLLGDEYVPKNLQQFQNIKYGGGDEYGILKSQAKGMSYYNKALSNEPDITSHIQSIAKQSGMDVAGLEYRIKSKDSYLTKIRRKYDPSGNEYEVKDILRYTYTTSSNSLVDKTLNSIDGHSKSGYNTIEVNNYWTDKQNPYNGINTTLRAPNGQAFELQYHTPESFNIKNGEMHKLYEEQRIIKDVSSKEYMDIDDKMFKLSDSMKVPKNIEKVKNYG